MAQTAFTKTQSCSDHAREIRRTIESKAANSPVASSWRRCIVLHELDPDAPGVPRRLSANVVEAARQINAELIEIAAPHIDHVFKQLGSGKCSILLCESDGFVIEARAEGVRDCRDRAIENWIGIDLSERSEGTNAIGTSLVEKRPITIAAGQHFYARNMGMTCSCAPIFDPQGELVGAIDIARSADPADSLFDKAIMAIAVEIGRRIEVDLFARAFPKAHKVMASREGGHYAAFVAVDSLDRVVGATHAARQLLGLTAERMRAPFPAADLWPVAAIRGGSTLAASERRAIERALADQGDNISATAKLLGISRGTLHRKMAMWRV